ncbi:MAG: response regulator [Bacteroidales bacterium]|nr:response regulator [Bacteroidales bacterium]
MKILIATLIFILCFCQAVLPQSQYLFDNSKGLYNSRINDISIDRDGMIWLATMNGLSVFDGRNFSEHIFVRPNILKICPLVDSDQTLIATSGGVEIYNHAQATFSHIPFADGTMVPFIRDIVSNDTIAFIATSGHGLYCYHPGDTVITKSDISHLIDNQFINTLYLDSKDRLWVGAAGVNTYIVRYGACLNTPSGIPPDINRYVEDRAGNIYAASASSGVTIITSRNQTSRIPLEGIGYSYPVASIITYDDKLLIGTDGLGLWEYDPQSGDTKKILADDISFDFEKSKIHDIAIDDDGNIWLAIYQRGLMLIPKESPIFDNYYYRPNSPKNIGSNSVGALAKHKDEIWIGTEGDGIYIVEPGKPVVHVDITDKDHKPIMANIISMCNQDDKYMWVGTYNIGFLKIDIATRRTVKIFDIPSERISSISREQDGRLLLASWGGGIGSFDTKTETYARDLLVNPQWANCIVVDNQGDHWIGTYDGLWYVDSEVKKSRRYTVLNGYLTDNTVNYIFIDGKNCIWCATNDGIMIINPVNNNKRHLLAGVLVCSIIEDEMGYIWVSTQDGLYRFSSQLDSCMRFGIEDGLQGTEFASRAAILTNNGMACFGGPMGITLIKNNNPSTSPSAGKVVLRGITINNSEVSIGEQYEDVVVLSKNIADADTIELKETLNYFSVQFASSNPANIEQTSFKYRMIGFDSTYTRCAKGVMQASYTNLKRGTYTLEIVASIRNISSEPRRLTIIIHPAWYNTIAVKTMAAILVALIIFFIYTYFKEKNKRRQSEEINAMKMQFFFNISHEVRTPLSLIIDPLDKLLSRPNNDADTLRLYNVMKVNSQRILRLVSQLLDLGKIDTGQVMMKFGKTELCSFVREILETCTPLSDTKEININLTNNHNSEIYAWIDPENFEKVMLNLIHNAIKFASVGGQIDIDISQYDDENKIRVTVQDNGIGIQETELDKIFRRFYQVKSAQTRYTTGTGVGLHLSKYLVDMHKGRLYAENRTDKQGSRFIVELQMGKDHLPPDDIVEQENFLPQWYTARNKIVDKRQSSSASRKKTIFVIDDEDSIRTYLSEQLSGDYNTLCYENGKKAFENVVSANPDLVICDIMMPEMDGWTFCKKVKKNFKTSHIPIILLTALGDDANKTQGIDIGADMYIEKPFNTEMLKKIIKNMIQNREKVTDNIVQKADVYSIENIELKSQDQILMQKVQQIIKEKISHRDLNVELLADTIGISRVHLHRKIKEITGLSARDYLKNIRMKQASLLLTDRNLTISEIAYAVGYSNPAHFSASFKAFYGVSPTDYSGRANKDDEPNTAS